MEPTHVTMMQAAAILRKSYNQTLRLVLIGEIGGEQRNGHWIINAHDVLRYKRIRDVAAQPT